MEFHEISLYICKHFCGVFVISIKHIVQIMSSNSEKSCIIWYNINKEHLNNMALRLNTNASKSLINV
jgi:hypothetical protein